MFCSSVSQSSYVSWLRKLHLHDEQWGFYAIFYWKNLMQHSRPQSIVSETRCSLRIQTSYWDSIQPQQNHHRNTSLLIRVSKRVKMIAVNNTALQLKSWRSGNKRTDTKTEDRKKTIICYCSFRTHLSILLTVWCYFYLWIPHILWCKVYSRLWVYQNLLYY